MGQIVGTFSDIYRCNIAAIQTGGSKANTVLGAGEVWLVNSLNALSSAFSGDCDSYIMGDGTHAASALQVRFLYPELYKGGVVNVPFHFGVIGAADGTVYSGNTDYLYSDAIPITSDTELTIHNPTQKSLGWIRIFFYNNNTFVRYVGIKNSPSSDSTYTYTAQVDGTFNNVRFNMTQGDGSHFSSESVITASYVSIVSTITDIEDRLSDLEDENLPTRVTALEANITALSTKVDSIEPDIIDLIKHDGETVIPTWTKGQYIDLNGALVVNNNDQLATTDYIEIPYGLERITMYDIGASLVSNQFSFYNSSKTYISGGSGAISSIPSNAAYVRFCSYSPSETFTTSGYKFTVFDNSGSSSSSSDPFRSAVAEDIDANANFYIEDGKLYGTRASTDGYLCCLFREDITAIEFEISSFWDNNLITLAFGDGIDDDDVDTFAGCYLPTTTRTGEIGSVRNANSATPQANSIWGHGRFSGEYRQPQVAPPNMAIGNKCRIELINGTFFRGSYYSITENKWKFWFALDTLGEWYTPNRYGWNTSKRIGFAIFYAATSAKEMVKNIKILSEKGTASEVFWRNAQCYPEKRNWVAIGDSITQINKNNGLSYVGFASRALGWNCNNQGQGGWTIYKLWRDRSTAGWESAVSSLSDNDVITILAGTNDFDTKSFATPASDAAMDAAGNPHPRFGTTDPTADDAKDPHTTLGCLRLIIEDIQTLKPNARLVIFSPFYREKGTINGSTGWEKDLYVNSDGKTIYDYADAIAAVGREYNLPSYNTCRDCGINIKTLETYTYDDLHIGQLGGQLIGEYVAKRIGIK